MKYLAFLSCLLVAVVSTPLRAATTVGTTTGQFATTPSGGMTYSIPLALPEGAGGVKPQIAITYSSQGGYGILGQGWSVSGSQAITRCPSTVAQDGRYDPVDFDSYDRFCLNGARLVVHGSGSYGAVGTEYRTEVDQFSKVVSYGGSNRNPSYFKVWTKSGDILHFGRYGNSRLPSSGKAIEWHLSRVEDRFGNYISYSYAQGTYFDGSYYFRLGTIDYSQNLNVNPGQAAYSIVLGYADGEDTPAVRTRMSAGVAIKLDRRLEEIEVRSNTSSSSLLRRYSFFYRGYNNLGMSQLASISECGADGECLPPTTFDWTSKFDAGVSVSQETFETHIGDLNDSIWGWVDMGRLKYGDFNADGFLDIYRVNGRNRTTPGTVYINDGNGNFPSYLQRQGPQHYVSDDQHDANFDVSTIRAIDINSDGYTDLYKIERGATGTVRDIVWLNNGNGTFANSQSIGALTPITPHYNSILGSSLYRQRALDDLGRVMFGEFNGDGYPDILYVNGHRSTAPVQIFINQSGQGFANPYNGPSLYVHDVSGGTRRDIARVKIIDLNSDGLDDIYIVKGADSAQQDEIYLNNGTGGFHTVKLSIATYVRNHDIIGKGDVNRIRFGDFNGDGFADLYYVEGTASSAIDTIYLNDGLGDFSSDRTINGPSTHVSIDDGDTRRYTLSMNRIKNVDYNADGLTDVYIVRGDYSAKEDKIWLNKGDGTWSPVFGPDTFVDGSSREALHRTIFDVARLVVADFTGDGLPDIFRINGLDGSEDDSLYIQIGSPLHVVDKITTGLGEEHVINYGFLTNPSLYERGCDLSANDSDTFDVINAMPVVREHFIKGASDEKLHHTSYTYAGLCADRTGRGSLGFEEVTTKNQITGVKEIAVRYQKFPKTGMLRNKRVERSNGDPIRISDFTYSDIEWGNSIYFYQSIEEEEHYELGSPWVPFKSKRITKLYAGSSNYLYGQLTNMTESFWSGPIGQSSADSNTISNTYDSVGSDWQLGRLLTSTVTKVNNGYQSSRRSSYTYNAQGAIKTETIEPLEEFATTRSYSYDSFGNVLSETLSADGLESRTTTRTYSADGRFLETERNALGHTVAHEHDARTGYLLSTTDANGLASRWQTNDLGRVTSVTAPDGKVTTTQWLACGYGDCEGTDAAFQVRTRTTSGAVGHADAYEEFDRHERPVAARVLRYGNRWAVSTTDYDRLSRVVQQSAPYFQGSFTTRYLTTTQYDELGRVTEVTRPTDDQAPTGTVDRMAYNGLRQSTTDSHNRTRTLVHNARGEVIEAIDPMGGSVTHLRDGFGLIRMTTDAGFNQTTFEYDKRGLKVAMNDPSMGEWSYEYNAYGELVSQTDAKGTTTTMAYDQLGRKVAQAAPRTAYEWTYDQSKKGTLSESVVYSLAFAENTLGLLDGLTSGLNEDSAAWELLNAADMVVTGEVRTEHTYDSLVRPKSTVRYIDDQRIELRNTYDSYGRLYRKYFPGVGSLTNENPPESYITYTYSSQVGVITKVTSKAGHQLYQLRRVDARGNPTEYDQGSFDVLRYYDTATGQLRSILTDGNGLNDVQSLQYEWNAVGNLSSRVDHTQGGLTEYFQYDALDRMTSSQLINVSGDAVAGTNMSVTYDAMGNITSKSGVGTYTYNANKPFAISRVVGERSSLYQYDKNGSLLAAAGLTVAWSPFRKPLVIQRVGGALDAGSALECAESQEAPPLNVDIIVDPTVQDPCVAGSISTLAFGYDASNQRAVRRELTAQDLTDLNSSETDLLSITPFAIDGVNTYYLGGSYERRVEGLKTTSTFYVNVGGMLVAAITEGWSSDATGTRHLFTDHLGSVDVVALSSSVEEKTSFDAFGKRRAVLNWQNDSLDRFTYKHRFVKRGFTGHEQLDSVGLVHMNGRIYDPVIGRFLSADPIVQAPENTQSYNRYSYVFNNPLKYTDPSGYSAWSKIKDEARRFESSFRNELRRPDSMLGTTLNIVVYALASWGCGPGAPACVAAWTGIGGAAVARGQGASDEDAALAGVVSAASAYIGNSNLYGGSDAAALGRVATIGAISGAYAQHQGGEFGSGFAASVVGSGFGTASHVIGGWEGALLSAVVGGSISEMSGGKFANGAVTAAFAYAVSSARRGGIGGSGGSKTLARDADGNLIRSDEVAGPFVEGDARISSRYGVTRIINGQSNLHAGVDLVPLTVDGTVNTSAYAISGTEGALVNAGVSSSFGNYVLVKTPGGNYVFYSHLASHATNIPTQISVGTRLGIIGNTGRSTGLHLHVEIRQGGYGTGAARLSPGAIYE